MAIRVGIIGVGNCAAALIQGVSEYGRGGLDYDTVGFGEIGGYLPEDIEFVLAYDVDRRKVGKPLAQAVYAGCNCVNMFEEPLSTGGACLENVCNGTKVLPGMLYDGVAPHMSNSFRPLPEEDLVTHQRVIIEQLEKHKPDMMLIYLPVGSVKATEAYVECCILAGIPFINCIPVFIVSNPKWGKLIADAGLCAIGDDMRSQFGASILSQVLQETLLDRGLIVQFHCQTNMGGNTDFQNMEDHHRLADKRTSKENVILSQSDLRNKPQLKDSIFAGPACYVPKLGDNKVAHIRIEALGFGEQQVELDCKLSVQDSPNSAGIVIDAIRYLKVATELGIKGPLVGPSALTQKTPPVQLPYAQAMEMCKALARREVPGQ